MTSQNTITTIAPKHLAYPLVSTPGEHFVNKLSVLSLTLGLAVLAAPMAQAGILSKLRDGRKSSQSACCDVDPCCCQPVQVVCCQPAPVVCCEPAPVVCCKPAPVVCCEPAPVVCCEPVCCEPVCCEVVCCEDPCDSGKRVGLLQRLRRGR